jgi:NADPH-dependent curcumin reductase CurA
MSKIISREIRLASRPKGRLAAANFTMAQTEVDSPQEGEVLVRNLFMSVDPYMRGRMDDRKSYVPPFEIGKALEGGALGEVIESRAPNFRQGDVVVSGLGWREYFKAPAKALRPVNREVEPPSIYLGLLGTTGLTAWAGLQMAEIKKGETLFVSGAAGAVGSVAGQLAKLRGCRVVGSAGSEEKVRFLLEECDFDSAFNYKTQPMGQVLKQAAPDGLEIYFDNVGGETLQAALSAMKVHGRIIACGSISGYNDEKPRPGPSNLFNIVIKRLTIKGLLVLDWLNRWGDFEKEVSEHYRAGRLKNRETVVEGLDRAVEAFIGLFDGLNVGKMIVKLPSS